jgi:hypothetical protein
MAVFIFPVFHHCCDIVVFISSLHWRLKVKTTHRQNCSVSCSAPHESNNEQSIFSQFIISVPSP